MLRPRRIRRSEPTTDRALSLHRPTRTHLRVQPLEHRSGGGTSKLPSLSASLRRRRVHRSTSAVNDDRQGGSGGGGLDDRRSRHYSPPCGDGGVMRGATCGGGRGNVVLRIATPAETRRRVVSRTAVGSAATRGVASAGDFLLALAAFSCAAPTRCNVALAMQLRGAASTATRFLHRR